jgi:hypothetical protein
MKPPLSGVRGVPAAIAGYAVWEGSMLTHQHQLTLSRVSPLPFPQHRHDPQSEPLHNVERTAKSPGTILKGGEGARRAFFFLRSQQSHLPGKPRRDHRHLRRMPKDIGAGVAVQPERDSRRHIVV